MTTFVRNLLYRQVKDHILGELAAGHWKAGEMLPSEKLFAEQLGVSQGTVRKAIQELVEENVLYREQGRGTFVQSYLASGYCNSFHRFHFKIFHFIHSSFLALKRALKISISSTVVILRFFSEPLEKYVFFPRASINEHEAAVFVMPSSFALMWASHKSLNL